MYSQKLSVNKLKTDMSYQSPVKDAQVKKIVKDFDPQKLHTIVVNRRDDMNFYIIDGQHRVEALKELSIPLVEATVHEGLTIQQDDINQMRPNFSSKKECLPVVVADIYNKRRRKSFQLDKRLLFI